MNTDMLPTLVYASQAYLSAARLLKGFVLEDDQDTLIPFVGELIDAGFNREEILEAAKHMGRKGDDWIDTVSPSVIDERPWLQWGQSIN